MAHFRNDTVRDVVQANGESLTLNQAVAIASALQYVGEQAEEFYGGVDNFPAPLKDFLQEVAAVTLELSPPPAEVQEVSFADLGLSVEDLDKIFGL